MAGRLGLPRFVSGEGLSAMPPQPLSSYRDRPPIFTSAQGTVEERPEHALLAADIIAQAASADAFFGSMLVTLLGADSKPSFAMYEAIHQTAKTQALRAAASHALKPDDRDLLFALMLLFKGVDRHRNRLAHWLWAYSGRLPDGLLLIDPEANFRFLVEVSGRLARDEQQISDLELELSRVLVYRKQDLAEVAEEYGRLREHLRSFNIHIHPHLHLDGWKYHALTNAPEIRQALDRVRGRGLLQEP